MSTLDEADARAAQEKITQLLTVAQEAMKEAQALADAHGLSFTYEATDRSDGRLYYEGEEDGNNYSLGGDWYSSNC
jgi:hypothetical protein